MKRLDRVWWRCQVRPAIQAGVVWYHMVRVRVVDRVAERVSRGNPVSETASERDGKT